jgi:hypothetical protein
MSTVNFQAETEFQAERAGIVGMQNREMALAHNEQLPLEHSERHWEVHLGQRVTLRRSVHPRTRHSRTRSLPSARVRRKRPQD